MHVSTGKIERQFQKLHSRKEKLMKTLSALSTEAYAKQPAPNSWSAAQAANHIFMSERLSLAYLKKKSNYPDTIPPFHVKSWGSVLLIKFILWTSLKVKAPKAINMWEQQPVYSPADLEQKWNEVRTDLISFIQENQPKFGSHLLYNHPFAGRLTMHQMLIFLNDHMAHHMKQIDRIIMRLQKNT